MPILDRACGSNFPPWKKVGYPFTPKSDQFQISPKASPEILNRTVWRTWLFIAYSDERCTAISHWENVLFELGSERVKSLEVGRCSWCIVFSGPVEWPHSGGAVHGPVVQRLVHLFDSLPENVPDVTSGRRCDTSLPEMSTAEPWAIKVLELLKCTA